MDIGFAVRWGAPSWVGLSFPSASVLAALLWLVLYMEFCGLLIKGPVESEVWKNHCWKPTPSLLFLVVSFYQRTRLLSICLYMPRLFLFKGGNVFFPKTQPFAGILNPNLTFLASTIRTCSHNSLLCCLQQVPFRWVFLGLPLNYINLNLCLWKSKRSVNPTPSISVRAAVSWGCDLLAL